MMLFRILKLFGVDVPARIARVRAKFEQRVEIARDQVRPLRREREWWHGYEYFLIGDQIVVVPPLDGDRASS
jgi:hypothetical protein